MSRYYSETALSLDNAASGDALAVLRRCPTEVDVVRFCAAIRNFHRFHYDQDFMQKKGQGRIIIPGFMLGNWCLEATTRGFEPGTEIAGLSFRNTHVAPIGETYEVRGQVSATDAGGATCEFEVINSRDKTVVTTATVRLRRDSSAP